MKLELFSAYYILHLQIETVKNGFDYISYNFICRLTLKNLYFNYSKMKQRNKTNDNYKIFFYHLKPTT